MLSVGRADLVTLPVVHIGSIAFNMKFPYKTLLYFEILNVFIQEMPYESHLCVLK